MAAAQAPPEQYTCDFLIDFIPAPYAQDPLLSRENRTAKYHCSAASCSFDAFKHQVLQHYMHLRSQKQQLPAMPHQIKVLYAERNTNVANTLNLLQLMKAARPGPLLLHILAGDQIMINTAVSTTIDLPPDARLLDYNGFKITHVPTGFRAAMAELIDNALHAVDSRNALFSSSSDCTKPEIVIHFVVEKRGRHTKKIIGIVADNGHGMSQEELIKNAQAGKQPDGPSQWSDLASAATLYMDSTVSKYGVGQKMAVAHVRPDPNKQSVKYVVISKTQDANSVAEVWFEAKESRWTVNSQHRGADDWRSSYLFANNGNLLGLHYDMPAPAANSFCGLVKRFVTGWVQNRSHGTLVVFPVDESKYAHLLSGDCVKENADVWARWYDLFLTPPFGALHAPLFRQPLYDQHLFIEEFANQLNFQKLAPSQRLAFSEPRIPVNITFSVELAPANPDASHIETEIFELAECARRQDANKAAPIVMFALYQAPKLIGRSSDSPSLPIVAEFSYHPLLAVDDQANHNGADHKHNCNDDSGASPMDIDSDPYREVIDLSRIETIDVDSPYDAYEAKAAGSAQASGSSDRSKGSEETTDPAQLAATKRLNHMEVFYKGRLVHGEKISSTKLKVFATLAPDQRRRVRVKLFLGDNFEISINKGEFHCKSLVEYLESPDNEPVACVKVYTENVTRLHMLDQRSSRHTWTETKIFSDAKTSKTEIHAAIQNWIVYCSNEFDQKIVLEHPIAPAVAVANKGTACELFRTLKQGPLHLNKGSMAVLAPASKGNDPPVFFRFLGVIQPSKKTRDESLAVGILEPQTAFSPSDVPVGIVVPLRMIEAMESKDVGTRFEHNSPLFPNLRQFQTFWNDTPPIIKGSDTLRATDYLPDIEVSFPKAAWYERCAPFFSIELAVSGSRSEPKLSLAGPNRPLEVTLPRPPAPSQEERTYSLTPGKANRKFRDRLTILFSFNHASASPSAPPLRFCHANVSLTDLDSPCLLDMKGYFTNQNQFWQQSGPIRVTIQLIRTRSDQEVPYILSTKNTKDMPEHVRVAANAICAAMKAPNSPDVIIQQPPPDAADNLQWNWWKSRFSVLASFSQDVHVKPGPARIVTLTSQAAAAGGDPHVINLQGTAATKVSVRLLDVFRNELSPDDVCENKSVLARLKVGLELKATQVAIAGAPAIALLMKLKFDRDGAGYLECSCLQPPTNAQSITMKLGLKGELKLPDHPEFNFDDQCEIKLNWAPQAQEDEKDEVIIQEGAVRFLELSEPNPEAPRELAANESTMFSVRALDASRRQLTPSQLKSDAQAWQLLRKGLTVQATNAPAPDVELSLRVQFSPAGKGSLTCECRGPIHADMTRTLGIRIVDPTNDSGIQFVDQSTITLKLQADEEPEPQVLADLITLKRTSSHQDDDDDQVSIPTFHLRGTSTLKIDVCARDSTADLTLSVGQLREDESAFELLKQGHTMRATGLVGPQNAPSLQLQLKFENNGKGVLECRSLQEPSAEMTVTLGVQFEQELKLPNDRTLQFDETAHFHLHIQPGQKRRAASPVPSAAIVHPAPAPAASAPPERLDEADQKLAAILQQHPKVRARVQQRIRDSDFSKAKLDAVQKALQDYIGELQTALDEVQTLRGTLSKRRKNG